MLIHPRTRLLTATLLAALAAPAGAHAAVQTVSVDGPGSGLVGSDDIRIDAAPDGTAALAYRKTVGGLGHVFVSVRQADGTWSAAEQVDATVPGAVKASGQPALAVGNGGRVVVVYANGDAGTEKLYTSIKVGTATPFSPVQTVQGNTAGWKDPQLDLAPNGNGFVTVQEAKHVRAFRLQGSNFQPVGAAYPVPDPPALGGGVLNVDEPEPGDMRGAKVAVDAAGGNATVVWTESPVGGEYHLYARRLSGLLATEIGPRVESFVPTFQGHAGETLFSDMATVATAGDVTWVGYRAAFTYNSPPQQIPRAIVRTFDGTSFGPPQTIDGIPAETTQGAEFPRIALGDGGRGLAASYRQLTPFGTESSILTGGTWSTGSFVAPPPSEVPGRASVALDASGGGLVAFRSAATPTTGQVLGRYRGGALDGQLETLSSPAYGEASSPYFAAAGGGRGFTAFLQGTGATSRVVAATVDLPSLPPPTPTPAVPAPVATPAGPGPLAPPAAAPPKTALTAVKFRSGKTSATIRRGSATPKIVKATSAKRTFSLSLATAGAVRLTLQRVVTGRKKGGRCVAGKVKSKSAKCTFLQAVKGDATLRAAAGVNHVQFEGRLSASRTLPTGNYELTVVATAPGLAASAPTVLRFRLLAAAKKK